MDGVWDNKGWQTTKGVQHTPPLFLLPPTMKPATWNIAGGTVSFNNQQQQYSIKSTSLVKGCARHITDSLCIHGYIRGYESTSKCGARKIRTDEVQTDDDAVAQATALTLS